MTETNAPGEWALYTKEGVWINQWPEKKPAEDTRRGLIAQGLDPGAYVERVDIKDEDLDWEV